MERALKNTADDITDFGGIEFCIWDQGAGRMNVKEAYLALREGTLVDDEWSVGQVLPGVYPKTFTVINNAAEEVTLTIAKSVMTDTQGVVAGNWITVPASITVPAEATATFDAVMSVPAAAAAGTYFGYVILGDITIPVSVNVIQPVDHLTAVDITGTVDEDAALGDQIFYTLSLEAGIANLSLSLKWLDVANDLHMILYNPLGEAAASSLTAERPEVISVDSPVPGKWTVARRTWDLLPRLVETYTLTVDATGT
ncbi:hypothetical protein M1O20_01650, partial [Dehalococcoidia bacterium]|nr:hypothetical protein [Dehalococcoidia bacterium]